MTPQKKINKTFFGVITRQVIAFNPNIVCVFLSTIGVQKFTEIPNFIVGFFPR